MNAASPLRRRLVLVAFLLLVTGLACSSDPDTPGATSSPTGLGSPSGAVLASPTVSGGVIGTPVAGPSYSPFGFETCEPEQLEMPDWIPDDLPLPEGTYATAFQPTISGYERGFFVIPGPTTIQDFTKLVVEEWPKVGYELGRGDSEAGEVESEFTKPPAVGAFKVQATTCGYSAMLLIYAPNGPQLSPTPSPSG
jgi:hypothetical protein